MYWCLVLMFCACFGNSTEFELNMTIPFNIMELPFYSPFTFPMATEPVTPHQLDNVTIYSDTIVLDSENIIVQSPPITRWSKATSRDMLAKRSFYDAMKRQKDLLRTEVLNQLYACTTGNLYVPFPHYATEEAIVSIENELRVNGYAVFRKKRAYVISVPKPKILQ